MSHHHNPRFQLTSETRHLLDRIERSGHVPLHALNPAQAKQSYEVGAGLIDIPSHKLPRVEDLVIPARDGFELHARLYAPLEQAAQKDALPVLYFLHGGGFTVGSVKTHEPVCRRLAHLSGAAVVSLEYRLAPEAKFPTAVNDAWDGLLWLREHAARLGLNAQKIAVSGDSAGGTLAIVTAISARDAQIPLSLQVLFYPGCIGHQDTESHHTFARGFLLEEAHITYFFEQYLRSASDRDDWRFAPLDGADESGHRRDLDGVAPAWIGLAECDPLVDEGVAFGDALRMAGVPVDLEIYRGVIHGFLNQGRVIPEALRVQEDAARALKKVWEMGE
ncbi:alpha/beta hydrolase [Hydrogenophaga sp. 5NK40-0174]|uniref:alpha/beta hydrolase n=1 Tax=Hydrogenophaga sp. 5NK40-0174 TaxID=3127649 RepID=UPI0031076491